MKKLEYISKCKSKKQIEYFSKLPEFVRLQNGCALRLRCEFKDYYRDVCRWHINFRYKNNKLLTLCLYDEVKHFKNLELSEITEKEWYNDNYGYIPKEYSICRKDRLSLIKYFNLNE